MSNARGVEDAILSLIKPGGLRAMTLFSEWGTGKTHLVQTFFDSATTRAKLKDARLTYIYVSLFGADSLEEVRRRLAVATLKAKGHAVLRNVKRFWGLMPSTTAIAGVDIDLSSLGDLAADYIQQSVVRDLFVVFDDLERAEKLEVNEILGLIAELTEQFGSKCLLVYNRAKLTTLAPGKVEALKTSQEKVFDLNIEYQPAIADNVVHGFANPDERAWAKPVFEKFRNGNIRIMRRAAWALQTLRDAGAHHAELWPQVVQHVAILAILQHAHSTAVPDLPKALSETTQVMRLFGQKTPGDFPDEIRTALDELEFESAPFDLPIVGLLETGSVSRPALDAAIAAAREKRAKNMANTALFRFWEELRNGFVVNPAEFRVRLKQFVAEGSEQLSPGELAQLCDLLLELDPSDEHRRLVAQKFTARFLHVSPAERRASFDKFPAILAAKVDEMMPYVAKDEGPALDQMIREIAGSADSCTPTAYRELHRFTDEQIRDYLLAQRGHHAVFFAKRMLERVPKDDPKFAEAMRGRIKGIVVAIGRLSPVHRFQVEYFIKEKVPPA